MLIMFQHFIIQCYHCENSPSLCKTNNTCLSTEDACLQMRFGITSSCWKMSQCNVNDIAVFYQLDNFEYFCCQQDLCNEILNKNLENFIF
uniref:CD59 glycoprotein n=1 Tax=Cairina moschata TaxID=8855 RepID=A0A8C3BF15_CAIMO